MPRMTSEQLKEARLRKREEEERLRVEEEERLRAEKQKKLEEQAAREAALVPLRERLAYLQQNSQRTAQLKSVLLGLYEEIDKLAKRAPADQITELALKRTNDVIKKCKDLMKGDEFVDSIDSFVAAGERPEYRDVILVVRDLRQGITRLEEEAKRLWNHIHREQKNLDGKDEEDEDHFAKTFTH